ncbi:MAG TPA: hypothetical protein VFI06_11210, partial [Chitinophagaceae bacterium]|nr:hypothetical protein [Chitinophagaceae bacterium]
MKKLVYLFALVFNLTSSAQYYDVKNVNDEYVVTNLKGSERFKNNIKEVIRDRNGVYWFQNLTDIASFDGVNWKTYNFKSATGRSVPLRINDIEVTDDSTIWLASQEGMFVFDPLSENFILAKQRYPAITGMPPTVNCIYKGNHDFLFISIVTEGFYVFSWESKSFKRVIID